MILPRLLNISPLWTIFWTLKSTISVAGLLTSKVLLRAGSGLGRKLKKKTIFLHAPDGWEWVRSCSISGESVIGCAKCLRLSFSCRGDLLLLGQLKIKDIDKLKFNELRVGLTPFAVIYRFDLDQACLICNGFKFKKSFVWNLKQRSFRYPK